MANFKGFQVLSDKLQELNLQIIDAKNQLEDKRKCKNLSGSFITSKFVDVVGSFKKSPSSRSPQPEQDLLSVTSYFHRIHNGKWIIGISVINHSKSQTLTNFRMGMKGAHTKNMGEIHLLVSAVVGPLKPEAKRPRLEQDSEWREPHQCWRAFTDLSPGTAGYVLRVLDAPTFVGFCEEELSGVVFYSVKEGEASAVRQVSLPVFSVTAQHLAGGQLRPFRAQTGPRDQDVLAVVLSSRQRARLVVRTARACETPSLLHVLTESLDFLSPSRQLLYHQGNMKPELAGLLVAVCLGEGNTHTISVYARDDTQLYLLVHCLYAELPTNTVIFLPPQHRPSDRDILRSLKKEQKIVWNYLRSHDSLGDTALFRETLSEVECKTDQLILAHVSNT